MTTEAPSPHHVHAPVDFSIVVGGPLYRLLQRGRLLRAPVGLTYRRVAASIAVTWLPLVVLTALSGTLVGGVGVPLVRDIDANVKLLIALPLLIGAEPIVHALVSEAVEEFSERGLVAPEDEPRFASLVAWGKRLRNSAIIEAGILVLAFMVGHSFWRPTATPLHVATWQSPNGAGSGFSTAGYWYMLVSQPLARFILLRWYFRILVWYAFLFGVSRLKLRLNPGHPDRAGGLGFLEHTATAFLPLLVAQSTFSTGLMANRILYGGAKLPDFKFEIGGVLLFLLLQALLPLLFFVLHLAKAKVRTDFELGRVAAHLTNAFGRKWFTDREFSDETLLSAADFSALADLGGSYAVARSMRTMPFDPRVVVALAVIVALPMMPLALTMVPLSELVKGVVKLVL